MNLYEEKFNIAIQGPRQPGSAFKPFVLIAALASGVSPDDHYRGPATICLRAWKPDCTVHNFGNQTFGAISVANATVKSVNTVFAQLVLEVGPEKVRDVARRMGINGIVERKLGVRVPAIEAVPALGSEEVTPLEMASAYATLAARGMWREPKFVLKVTDQNGKVLEEGPSPAVRAVSKTVADKVNQILTGVITRGTGTRADIGRPAAGKTRRVQRERSPPRTMRSQNLSWPTTARHDPTVSPAATAVAGRCASATRGTADESSEMSAPRLSSFCNAGVPAPQRWAAKLSACAMVLRAKTCGSPRRDRRGRPWGRRGRCRLGRKSL